MQKPIPCTPANPQPVPAATRQPDVVAGLHVQSHLKITDPTTGQVLLTKRA
jgi:hypothetical protein